MSQLKTIEEVLQEEIPKDHDCNKCPHRFADTCNITEEKIGFGETYCDLSEVIGERIKDYKMVIKENEKENKEKFIKITPEMFRDVEYSIEVKIVR